MTGAELQAQLEDAIKNGSLSLSPQTLGSAAVSALIGAFFPSKSLDLHGATLSLSGDTVTLTGSLSLLSVTWTVSGSITAGASALTLVLAAKSPTGATVDLDTMVTEYLSISHPPPLPSLTVSSLTFQAGPSPHSYSLAAELSGDWKIPIGSTHLDLTAPGLTLAPGADGGAVTGSINASATMAGADLLGIWDLPKDFSLSGKLGKSVELMHLIDELAGPILPQPANLHAVSLNNLEIVVSKTDEQYRFFAQADAGNFGTIEVEVLDGPKAVAAFSLPANWKLADPSDLSPFSALTISGARVILSSFSDAAFAFPDGSLISDVNGVREGADFMGRLSLTGGAPGAVGKLLKQGYLEIRGLLGPDMELDAELSGGVRIIPGVALEDVSLGIKEAGDLLSVTLSAVSTVTIGRDSLTFTESASVSDDEATFSLSLQDRWAHPFGISGLTIDKVVLSIGVGSTETVGVYGAVDFGGNVEVQMAAQFLDGEDPDFLLGELDGKVTLAQIITAFTGISMPAALNQVSISNFKVAVVSNPLGVTLGDLTFPAGFSFHGNIDFFGFTVTAGMAVSDTRVQAAGTMSKVDFGKVFQLTDASGRTGLSMNLDTSGSPELQLSGRVALLGLAESLYGTVSDNGFVFDLKGSIGETGEVPGAAASIAAAYELSASYKKDAYLKAKGSVKFKFRASIGPIKTPTKPPLNLTTIHLDTAFNGTISLSVTDAFVLKVSGSFTWDGAKFKIPTLTIHEELSSLEALPQRIIDHIEDKAWHIFKSVLKDADAFFGKVDKGLATVGDDIGSALHGYYRKTSTEATALLNEAGAGSRTVVNALDRGYKQGMDDAAKLARGAKYLADDVGDAVHAVYTATSSKMASALHYAGYDAKQIAHSMTHTFPNIEAKDVAAALHGFKYEAGQVGGAMAYAFTGLTSREMSTALLRGGFGKGDVSDALQDVFHLGKSAADSMAGVVNIVSHTVTDAGHTVSHDFNTVKHFFSKL